MLKFLFNTKKKKSNLATTKLNTPAGVQQMDLALLREIVTHNIKTYKSLGYSHKNISTLAAKEWHSWQVSVNVKIF